MNRRPKATQSITFKLTEDLYKKITDIAEQNNRGNISQTMLDMIEFYIETIEKFNTRKEPEVR